PAGSSSGIASNDLNSSVHQVLATLTGISVLPSENLLTSAGSTSETAGHSAPMLSDHLVNGISALSAVGSNLMSNTTSLVSVEADLPETLALTQAGHVSTDGSLN